MSETLKYIKLGTDYTEYFNYDGSPLPIRPLSTYELDEATMCATKGVSPLVFNSVIKMKQSILNKDEELHLNSELYSDFLKYYNEVDYWTVYYSMKDFQEDKFSIPDYDGEFENDFNDWDAFKQKGYYIVRKMKYVHEIAKRINMMTDQPETALIETIANSEGKILAATVHHFKIPLNDKAWKLTPLQTKFLLFTRPGAPQMVKSKEDLPGVTGGTFEDVMKQMKALGLDIG